MEDVLLTFKDGRFRLRVSDSRVKLPNADLWNKIGPAEYETNHLRAAAAFRSNASPNTKNIFDNAFVKMYATPCLPPLPFLDPHQLDGLRWILSRSRSYIAHAPGAGKTGLAITAACLASGSGQTLFIVPPSLTLNWEREVMAFTERLDIWPTIGIVPRTARKSDMAWRADFIICPDSLLTKPWVYDRLKEMKIKFLAVDEASRFKEPMTARSLALYGGNRGGTDGGYKFSGLYRKARHAVLMDGSPMPNRPMELWAPTYAFNPEAINCMTIEEFGMRYCGPTVDERGRYEFRHSSNETELHRKLTKEFMHVVKEDQLNHPERRRSLLFMNQDVRSAEHKTWERKHLGGLNLSDIDEESSHGELARFRRELGIRKVDWIAKYVAERLKEKNESILLFVWHREVAETLKLALSEFKPGVVIGGTSAVLREKYFQSFQAGKKKLIIGNILAMGRGHNLQRADRAIFGEFSWTDELNKQCEKRASRRGSEKAFVRCEYVVSPGSMDEKVLQSVFTKARRVERVIG